MTKIVVGVDGSGSSQQALRWAAHEAELQGLPLEALMAWGYLDQHHHPLDAPFTPDYDEAAAHLALASYVTDALGPDATDDVELRPVCDLPARALLSVCDEAALLVVGARGRGGFAGLLLGSVSQKVLHHATCPVAVVHSLENGATTEHEQRIVVGVDGSSGGDAALRWALEEGRRRDATVDVVHAWHMPYAAPYPYLATDFETKPFEESARETLDRTMERAPLTPDDRVNPILSLSGAAALLMETSKGADLVVVGSRGTSAVKAALLGSVSQQVAMHAPCTVVVVPERGS
jgi:nucleotide-binding universal stress UspA family protein